MNTAPASQTRSFTTIFLIEMWERFGFYGMQALIVYYMVQKLSAPPWFGAPPRP
jgi:POT family proton-dependent oligopeptide transporter